VKRSAIGFTLIELLVVILIISIVAGVAVISTKTNTQRQSAVIAKEFINQVQLAEQEALLRSTTFGLQINADGWQFKIFSNDKTASWNNTFKPYRLPHNLQITLTNQPKDDLAAPQIIISPSGELTPFTILLGKLHALPSEKIIGKNNGEVNYQTINAQ